MPFIETGADGVARCGWCTGSEAYRQYHDHEWGVPCRDERTLFEFLTLEGAQAGLSWSTILAKREGYRLAFADYDVERIASFTDAELDALMHNPGIVRNRLKIASVRRNAQAMLAFRQTHGSFSHWLWAHVDDTPLIGHPVERSDLPARTDLSDQISRSLIKLGFKFVGSTIIYAYLQAMGVVNDHVVGCHRHVEAVGR